MSGRTVVKPSLSVASDAKRKLDKVAEHFGMKHQVLIGRLVSWFVSQDEELQLIILDLATGDLREALIELLYCKHHGLSLPPELPGSVPADQRLRRAAAQIVEAAEAKRSRQRRRKKA